MFCITKPVKIGDINKKWLLVDASGCSLGRLSSQIACILMGKDKSFLTEFLDCGDNVIVINSDKIAIPRNKHAKKKYLWHTGFPGGQRSRSLKEMLIKNSPKVLIHAVKNMLHKNKQGRNELRKLRVFSGEEHNMQSVNPKKIELKYK